MDTVISNVATGLLTLTNAQLLSRGEVFNDIAQTQIKIGKDAGVVQATNSIILNATGAELSNNLSTDASSCFIKPIKSKDATSKEVLMYNTGTGEVSSTALTAVSAQASETKIKLGSLAGTTTHANNSIIINATGSALNNNATNDTSSCFIKPIKNKAATGKEVLMYDTGTGEVTSTAITNVAPVTTADLALKAPLNAPSFAGDATFNGMSHLNNNGSGYWVAELNNRHPNDTGFMPMISFNRAIGSGTLTYAGSIFSSTTATSYNTSSDYRLKNVIGGMENVSTRILALKPIRFSWKSTGTETDGFLAHEAQEVVPEAVIGIKDAVNEDGTPKYQGIDQSKLVPLLVAALQDTITRLQDALTRIEALEALVPV